MHRERDCRATCADRHRHDSRPCSKFKPFPKVDENEIWPEIELFATHFLTKLCPDLLVLQFGNVTGKLQPEDYDENMNNILDSLEKALRMPSLTSLSQQWEVPNNSLDCSLVAALICDSGKLTSILQRSLLARLQLLQTGDKR